MDREDPTDLSDLSFPPGWPPRHIQDGRRSAGLPPLVILADFLSTRVTPWMSFDAQGPLPFGWTRHVTSDGAPRYLYYGMDTTPPRRGGMDMHVRRYYWLSGPGALIPRIPPASH